MIDAILSAFLKDLCPLLLVGRRIASEWEAAVIYSASHPHRSAVYIHLSPLYRYLSHAEGGGQGVAIEHALEAIEIGRKFIPQLDIIAKRDYSGIASAFVSCEREFAELLSRC